MLPLFPQFKKLSFSDKRTIESLTAVFEPYSNYNFSSLWSWDYAKTVKVSELNGNLVVICNDQFSKDPSVNFLGNNKVNDTLESLFTFLRKQKLKNELNAVPRISVQGADPDRYGIEINRSSCDYVYDLNSLAHYTGPKYSHKRKAANQFERKFPMAELRTLNLSKAKIRTDINKLNQLWLNHKHNGSAINEFQYEAAAIKRFIHGRFANSLYLGLFVKNQLVGYSFFSLLDAGFSLCQFSKADTAFSGIYEYLMRESASLLVSKGYTKLNYEEDLGIEGLRQAKLSYKPVLFLEKYNVTQLK